MTFELSNQDIIDVLKCPVVITKKYVKIGDKFYPTDLWYNFTDEEIIETHGGSVEFWAANNPIIKSIINTEDPPNEQNT